MLLENLLSWWAVWFCCPTLEMSAICAERNVYTSTAGWAQKQEAGLSVHSGQGLHRECCCGAKLRPDTAFGTHWHPQKSKNTVYSISSMFVIFNTVDIYIHILHLHSIPLVGSIVNADFLSPVTGLQVKPAGSFLGLHTVTVLLNSVPARQPETGFKTSSFVDSWSSRGIACAITSTCPMCWLFIL